MPLEQTSAEPSASELPPLEELTIELNGHTLRGTHKVEVSAGVNTVMIAGGQIPQNQINTLRNTLNLMGIKVAYKEDENDGVLVLTKPSRFTSRDARTLTDLLSALVPGPCFTATAYINFETIDAALTKVNICVEAAIRKAACKGGPEKNSDGIIDEAISVYREDHPETDK